MDKDDFLKTLVNNIVHFRKANNLKQIDLAIQLDMEDSALRSIEKGKTTPTIYLLKRICVALEIDLPTLLSFDREL